MYFINLKLYCNRRKCCSVKIWFCDVRERYDRKRKLWDTLLCYVKKNISVAKNLSRVLLKDLYFVFRYTSLCTIKWPGSQKVCLFTWLCVNRREMYCQWALSWNWKYVIATPMTKKSVDVRCIFHDWFLSVPNVDIFEKKFTLRNYFKPDVNFETRFSLFCLIMGCPVYS